MDPVASKDVINSRKILKANLFSQSLEKSSNSNYAYVRESLTECVWPTMMNLSQTFANVFTVSVVTSNVFDSCISKCRTLLGSSTNNCPGKH